MKRRKASENPDDHLLGRCSEEKATTPRRKKEKALKKVGVKTSSVFKVLPLEQFDKQFPYYREPFEIGAFSVDQNRQFHNNKRKLRIYKAPVVSSSLDFDLKIGYKNFKARDEEIPERLDHLLNWVHLHRQKFSIADTSANNIPQCSLNTDFITWRGHLVKILCTPYETQDPWHMNACKYNGTIYISEVETEERKQQRHSQTKRQKEMCYWGYKFEDYTTKPFPFDGSGKLSSQNRENDELNNSEGFCSVIRSRLSQHSIVIGAEVDCCDLIDGKFKAPDNYIELKTSRIMDHRNQRRSFSRFKLKKFWAQSYLAGVPKIICGMRNDDGIVKKIETYRTMDIPKIASSNGGAWNAGICMNFLDSFLRWMKDIVVKDNPQIVYSFRFQAPFKSVSVEELPLGLETFIPDWFVAEQNS